MAEVTAKVLSVEEAAWDRVEMEEVDVAAAGPVEVVQAEVGRVVEELAVVAPEGAA